MSLSGNLEDVSVADALQFIHLGARTDTQMVLLDAVRMFDERNRGPEAAAPVSKETPAPAERMAPPAPQAEPERLRLQVVSADRQLVDSLAQALPDTTVARVTVQDAGT